MLSHFQKCTEPEAQTVLKYDSWEVSLIELQAFIALLFSLGVYDGRNIYAEMFWGKEWGISFFQQTMSGNRLQEIHRFLRLDLRPTKSIFLQTDKFALISEVWNAFISNTIVR